MQVGCGEYLTVESVRSLNVFFHVDTRDTHTGGTYSTVKMTDDFYVPGMHFNLFSPHDTQRKQSVIPYSIGVHLFGGRVTFPYGHNSCSLRAIGVEPSSSDKELAVSSNLPFASFPVEVAPPPSVFPPSMHSGVQATTSGVVLSVSRFPPTGTGIVT